MSSIFWPEWEEVSSKEREREKREGAFGMMVRKLCVFTYAIFVMP